MHFRRNQDDFCTPTIFPFISGNRFIPWIVRHCRGFRRKVAPFDLHVFLPVILLPQSRQLVSMRLKSEWPVSPSFLPKRRFGFWNISIESHLNTVFPLDTQCRRMEVWFLGRKLFVKSMLSVPRSFRVETWITMSLIWFQKEFKSMEPNSSSVWLDWVAAVKRMHLSPLLISWSRFVAHRIRKFLTWKGYNAKVFTCAEIRVKHYPQFASPPPEFFCEQNSEVVQNASFDS